MADNRTWEVIQRPEKKYLGTILREEKGKKQEQQELIFGIQTDCNRRAKQGGSERKEKQKQITLVFPCII